LLSSTDIGLQILENIPAFYYGTSPNKFFDYISSGVPVLNNYPGWLADLITDNDCGFVVSPDNPVEFANTLEKAANNLPDLKRKGSNARELASKKFDRKMLASIWVKKLNRYIEKSRKIKYG
jgi:Glycosyltransferase